MAPGGPVPTGHRTGAHRANSRFADPFARCWPGLLSGLDRTDPVSRPVDRVVDRPPVLLRKPAPVTLPVDRSVDRTSRSVARSDRVLHRTARPQARLTGLLEDLLS